MSNAPESDYPIITNFHRSLGRFFESVDLNQDTINKVGSAMGVGDAIERRLAINPTSPKELTVNIYPNLVINPMGGVTNGVYRPARTAVDEAPTELGKVDVDIYLGSLITGAISEQLTKIDLTVDDELQPTPELERRIAEELDITLKHEISHFCDPQFDKFYTAGLTQQQLEDMTIQKVLEGLEYAKETTEIKELMEDVKENTPSLPTRKKVFVTIGAVLVGGIADVGANKLGFDWPESTAIEFGAVYVSFNILMRKSWRSYLNKQASLDKSINNLMVGLLYEYQPHEIRARQGQEKYTELGKISTLNIRPDVRFTKKV